MTELQQQQFDKMKAALMRISSGYQTSDQIRESCEEEYGLDFESAIEMAYDNMQFDATNALLGIDTSKD